MEKSGIIVTQIGVIVRDLRASLEVYHRTLGWGPWRVYEFKPPRNHHTVLRGRPVEYSMLVAETRVGGVAFELIEPLDGPSIYKEFLAAHGEGIHHFACSGPGRGYDDNLEFFERQGLKILMGGRIGDSIRYYYLDSEPLLKVVIEAGGGSTLTPDWTYP